MSLSVGHLALEIGWKMGAVSFLTNAQHPTPSTQRRVAAGRLERGVTLVEVLIGLVVFVGIALPLFQFQARLGNTGQVRDLYAAYALLRGESQVLYANGELPPASREVALNGIGYVVRCTHERDSQVVSWTMSVEKGEKRIAGITGLLYAPEGAERGTGVR